MTSVQFYFQNLKKKIENRKMLKKISIKSRGKTFLSIEDIKPGQFFSE